MIGRYWNAEEDKSVSVPSRCHVNSSKGSEGPSAFLRRSLDARDVAGSFEGCGD